MANLFDLFDPVHDSLLFAQAEVPKPAAPKEAAPEGGGGPFSMLLPLGMIVVLFYFLMIRPERRKQAAQRALLAQIKKNDRVLTIGGIYGLVTNVQRDIDEVTIKVDEATNAKLRVTFGSIARVISDLPADAKPE